MITLWFKSGYETGVKDKECAITIPEINLADQFVLDDTAIQRRFWHMRLAFGSLDSPEMVEACEVFAASVPKSWYEHGVDTLEIHSDEVGKLALWHHVHITRMERTYAGKVHYFFEMETARHLVYNHKGEIV